MKASLKIYFAKLLNCKFLSFPPHQAKFTVFNFCEKDISFKQIRQIFELV